MDYENWQVDTQVQFTNKQKFVVSQGRLTKIATKNKKIHFILNYEDIVANKKVNIEIQIFEDTPCFHFLKFVRAVGYWPTTKQPKRHNDTKKNWKKRYKDIAVSQMGKTDYLDINSVLYLSRIAHKYHPIPVTRFIYVLKQLNILNSNQRASIGGTVVRREIAFLDQLKELCYAFSFEPQQRFGNKQVDAYFPEQNIAVEFDEEHHQQQKKEDIVRMQAIFQQGVKYFIRVFQYSPSYSQLQAIAFIHHTLIAGKPPNHVLEFIEVYDKPKVDTK